MKVFLNYCQGSNSGSAFYLEEEFPDGTGGGTRIAGAKCWGFIKTIKGFELTESDLENLIEDSKSALKDLKKYNKKKGVKIKL